MASRHIESRCASHAGWNGAALDGGAPIVDAFKGGADI
jgi:hypothetical protein